MASLQEPTIASSERASVGNRTAPVPHVPWQNLSLLEVVSGQAGAVATYGLRNGSGTMVWEESLSDFEAKTTGKRLSWSRPKQ
jgi:hypothetical protein